MRLTLLYPDAQALRPLLQDYLSRGIWFTERRRWFLWLTFTISGPPQAVQALRQALKERESREWWGQAW